MDRPALSVTSASVDQTRSLGRRVGELLQPGICIGLVGPLGAGKTQFVKGLAAGVGVPDDVTVNSPTFVIVNEYPGRLHVYHVDAYRLGGVDELAALGFEEMTRSGGVVAVEWADRVAALLPEDHLAVHFDHTGESSRHITLRAFGPQSQSIAAALAASP